MIQLSTRLQMVADLVEATTVIGDVGADHGYLACALVQQHKCVCAYAMDVVIGPLHSAQSTIDHYGLNGQVKTILSNGFEYLPNDCDSVIIAGMGPHTIIDILSRYPQKTKRLKQIVVQANKDPWTIRQWIIDQGYTLKDERCCQDGFDYVALSFTPMVTTMHYDAKAIYLGPKLMLYLDKTTAIYYQHLLDIIERLYPLIHDPIKKNKFDQHREWLDQWLTDYAMTIKK